MALTSPAPWPVENGDSFFGLGRESGSKADNEVAVSPLRLSRGPGSKAGTGDADSPLAVSRVAGSHTCCWVYTRHRQNIRMQWFQIWPFEGFLRPLKLRFHCVVSLFALLSCASEHVCRLASNTSQYIYQSMNRKVHLFITRTRFLLVVYNRLIWFSTCFAAF